MAIKTNEQCIMSLLKDLHPIEAALLVDRLIVISKLTREAIAEDPASFKTNYIGLCDKIDKHLND